LSVASGRPTTLCLKKRDLAASVLQLQKPAALFQIALLSNVIGQKLLDQRRERVGRQWSGAFSGLLPSSN